MTTKLILTVADGKRPVHVFANGVLVKDIGAGSPETLEVSPGDVMGVAPMGSPDPTLLIVVPEDPAVAVLAQVREYAIELEAENKRLEAKVVELTPKK